MAEERNILLGILAIILGILVISFPLFSVFTASVLAGFAIILLGIWLLVQSFEIWSKSKATSIAFLFLGLIAIVGGIGLFGNILAFSFLASFWIFFAGFFLIISGIMAFFTKEGTAGMGIGAVGIIIGIIYILLASFAWNPYYLALLIGIWLIIDGVTLFFISPKQLAEIEKSQMPK
ncbi:MAG: DUF308 domain-containing protein [Methanobacterium sp.]|uniref:DUF308 domain-containing protein n=1 Tax=Methanobacterium sp. TaxID=2164 RepID=UPI003D65BD4A|nr:DUF308 domain-containing protein [Methanobacterium sp.]